MIIVEKAIERFKAAAAYEGASPRLAETVEGLLRISENCSTLADQLEKLSPVGCGAIFEETIRCGPLIDRETRSLLLGHLRHLAESASRGADTLGELHSPMPESGQGAGSALGRDSELRAIKADHGLTGTRLPPFRTPKDKFAVEVGSDARAIWPSLSKRVR